MLKRNHYIVAFAAINTVDLLTAHTSTNDLIISNIAGLIACNIPDIDFNLLILKHRGITHTLWFWGLITLLTMQLHIPIITIGVSTAYLSHILIDAASIAGVRLMAPFTSNRADNKYGIYLGINTNGSIKHHHFNYHGYRVGSVQETIIAGLFFIYSIGLFSIFKTTFF